MVTVAVHLPLGALLVMGCGGLVWACPALPMREDVPLPTPISPTRHPPPTPPPADRNDNTTCTPGYYGAKCMIECGYCLENEPCDPYTGYCTVPCQPNFIEPLCQQLLNCSYLRYGRLCEQECGNCAGNLTCNYTNGYCKSCQKGWTPPFCQTKEKKKTGLSAQTVALSVGLGAPATLGAVAAVLQLVQCLGDGLPFLSKCGGEDSEEKLETVVGDVIPLPVTEDGQPDLAAAAAAGVLPDEIISLMAPGSDPQTKTDAGLPNQQPGDSGELPSSASKSTDDEDL